MKTIIWIVVIIIIVVIGWGFIGGQPAAAPTENQNNALPAEQQQTAPVQSAASENANSDITSPSDSSDEAVTKDTATIDAQMNNLNKDSASADQGLNDKPITQ